MRVTAAGKAGCRTLAALMLTANSLAAMAQATAAADLSGKYGCMSCHGLIHKQVGPGFAQIAERYRNDAEAPARLAGKIRGGSVGAWGRTIMPRHPQVSETDAQALAQWVLSRPLPR